MTHPFKYPHPRLVGAGTPRTKFIFNQFKSQIMNIVQIASLSKKGGKAYTAADTVNGFFIPKQFRDDIKPMDYVIVVDTTIQTAYHDTDGNFTDADGKVLEDQTKPVLTGKEVVRPTISFIGTFLECVKAKNQPAINAKAESLLVNKLANDALAEFGLTAAALEDAG